MRLETSREQNAAFKRGLDATSVLTVYVVLLLAVPSPMVVGPLGSAGAPSAIMAVGALFWWLWFQIHRQGPVVGSTYQPVRSAALIWLMIMLIVYAHAMSSPIPSDEVSPADNGMLKLVGFVGILLVANDGILSIERHRTLLRSLVIGIGLIALLGIIQYVTKDLIVDQFQIPGLTGGTADWSLGQRGSSVRPSGLSTSPIEFGVILAMALPIVVVFATKSSARRWLYQLILCATSFAILLSISRSALVCAAIGMMILASSWSTRARVYALGFAVAAAATIYVLSPGAIGTITRLFTGAADDPSVLSRTGSFDIAFEFFSASPYLGRGFGTFLPKYWILDNGYLGLLIEGGLLGLLGLLFLIITAAWAGRQARSLASNEFDKAVAQALVASIAAGATGLAFFDTFAFPQSAGTFFLMLGMAGAMLRLTTAVRNPHGQLRLEGEFLAGWPKRPKAARSSP